MSALNGSALDPVTGQLIGGKCQTCGLHFQPGGPHLVAQHCLTASRVYSDRLVALLKERDARIMALKLSSRLAWILVDASDGKMVRVAAKDFNAIPSGAGVRCEPVTGAEGEELVFEAVVRS